MHIHQVKVQHFRSIYDAVLECDLLTALVGANGAGKSTFLRAIAVFYNPVATIEVSDFYSTDTANDIIITVSYTELGDIERSSFRKYVHNDQLVVKKCISWDTQKQKATQTYYGLTLQHTAFRDLRDPALQFNQRRSNYQALRAGTNYNTLPASIQSDAILRQALDTWGSTAS